MSGGVTFALGVTRVGHDAGGKSYCNTSPVTSEVCVDGSAPQLSDE